MPLLTLNCLKICMHLQTDIVRGIRGASSGTREFFFEEACLPIKSKDVPHGIYVMTIKDVNMVAHLMGTNLHT